MTIIVIIVFIAFFTIVNVVVWIKCINDYINIMQIDSKSEMFIKLGIKGTILNFMF